MMETEVGLLSHPPDAEGVLRFGPASASRSQTCLVNALKCLLEECFLQCGASNEAAVSACASIAADMVERVSCKTVCASGCQEEVVELKDGVLPELLVRSFTAEAYCWLVSTPGVLNNVKNRWGMEVDLNMRLKPSVFQDYWSASVVCPGGRSRTHSWTRMWMGREFSDFPIAHFADVVEAVRTHRNDDFAQTKRGAVEAVARAVCVCLSSSKSSGTPPHASVSVCSHSEEEASNDALMRAASSYVLKIERTTNTGVAVEAWLPWMDPVAPDNRISVLSSLQFFMVLFACKTARHPLLSLKRVKDALNSVILPASHNI